MNIKLPEYIENMRKTIPPFNLKETDTMQQPIAPCHLPRFLNALTAVFLALALCTILFGCSDDATRAQHHLERARQFASEGRYNEAVLEYKNVLQIRPRDYDSYYQIAEIYIKMGRIRPGRRCIRQCHQR